MDNSTNQGAGGRKRHDRQTIPAAKWPRPPANQHFRIH